MITYKFGDIVLIGFPHTDLQGISKRPAVVLYDSGDQDVLVARLPHSSIRLKQITELLTGKNVDFSPILISDSVNRQQ